MAAASPARIEFDVNVDGRPHKLAARALAPDPAAAQQLARPVWFFCVHGATVDWRYWCTRIDGFGDAYDASAFFARRGIGTLAIDIIGVGDSPYHGDGRELGFENVAGAHSEAVRKFRERLIDGNLLPDLAPVADPAIIGLGHSGGGPLAVAQQALHRDFDALAPMGLSVGPFGGFAEKASFEEGGAPPVAELPLNAQGMVELPARTARFPNHLDDVPQVVVDAKTNLPFPPFWTTLVSGTPTLRYAREIVSPLFIAFGEIDTLDNPLGERRYYPSAEDVTIHIQPGMAHYHNFASTREELWLSVANWARTRAALVR